MHEVGYQVNCLTSQGKLEQRKEVGMMLSGCTHPCCHKQDKQTKLTDTERRGAVREKGAKGVVMEDLTRW